MCYAVLPRSGRSTRGALHLSPYRAYVSHSSISYRPQAMLHDETAPPTMTMVLAMGPKLLVKCAVERHLPTKAFDDYSSGEVSQLCTDATKVVQRSGVEYGEVSIAVH